MLQGATTAPRTGTAADVPEAPPREGVTVPIESARYGTIVAWHPNGSRLYYEDEHTKYFDVDPVLNTSATVEYTAIDTVHTAGPNCRDPPCARNLVERTNLTTGETTVIRSRYDPRETAAEWHDHVRVDERHVLVADMHADAWCWSTPPPDSPSGAGTLRTPSQSPAVAPIPSTGRISTTSNYWMTAASC